MATFFGDSFDLYTAPADMSAGYWDNISTLVNTTFVPGRFSPSRALRMGATSTLTHTSGSNDSIFHLSFANLMENIPGGTTIYDNFQLIDGATVQCCLAFRSDGAMVLLSGAGTGTTLATFTGAVPTANVWNQFECEIIISNTVGRLQVRKNGNTSDDFDSGATLKTQNSANAYANKITYAQSAASVYDQLDDFLWRSDVTAPAWAGDIRAFTRMPRADVSATWSRSGTTVPRSPNAPTLNTTPTANQARYQTFVPDISGTITAVAISFTTASTSNFKCAIYDATGTGGGPGAVLGSATAAISSPAVGSPSFSFSPAVAVTAGTSYFIAIDQDGATGQYQTCAFAANCWVWTAATYASFPTANPPAIAGPNSPVYTVVSLTPTTPANAYMVNEPQQDGTTTYVYSSTVGQSDLYNVATVTGTPALILGVTTRGFLEKTDAGVRSAAVQLQSGSTNVQSASTPLNTSWGWIYRNDLVDPATGAAWTATAVNNVQIGAVVTA